MLFIVEVPIAVQSVVHFAQNAALMCCQCGVCYQQSWLKKNNFFASLIDGLVAADHMRETDIPILNHCKHKDDNDVDEICAGELIVNVQKEKETLRLELPDHKVDQETPKHGFPGCKVEYLLNQTTQKKSKNTTR